MTVHVCLDGLSKNTEHSYKMCAGWEGLEIPLKKDDVGLGVGTERSDSQNNVWFRREGDKNTA